MMISYLVALAAFVIGMGFYTGKAIPYIDGLKELSGKELEDGRIYGLLKNTSIVFFAASAIFLATGYSMVFRQTYFKWSMFGWIILCYIYAMFITRSKKYKNM